MTTPPEHLRVSFPRRPGVRRLVRIAVGSAVLCLSIGLWVMMRDAQNTRQAVETAFRNADTAERQGDYQAATDCLRALLERYPDNGPARFRLGKTLYDRGDRLGARQQLVDAAKVMPDNPEVWDLAGRACKAVNDYGAAEDAFRHAAQLEPHNAGTLTDLAGAQAVDRKLEEAEATYRRALAVNGSDAKTLFALAGFLQDYRAVPAQRAEARKLLKAALRLDNTNRDAWFRLGSLEMERGKPENAVVYLKIAVDQAAEKWNGWYALAQAYQQLGDRPHAREALARYHAIRDRFAELKVLRERISQVPDDPELHRELTHLYEKRGEKDNAEAERRLVRQLEQILEQNKAASISKR